MRKSTNWCRTVNHAVLHVADTEDYDMKEHLGMQMRISVH